MFSLFSILISSILNLKTVEEPITEEIRHSNIHSVFSLRNTWKLLLTGITTAVIRIPFISIYTILPRYLDREFKDTYYWVILLSSFILVSMLTMPLSIISYYTNPRISLIVSGMISSICPLIMWLGTEYYTVLPYVYLACLSEAILSPQLAKYANALAVEGKVGDFMSLSTSSFFLAVCMSSGLSLYLLDEYCPQKGGGTCEVVWFSLSVVAVAGTVSHFLIGLVMSQPLEKSPQKRS